jgi:iron-sulfur cluster assembly protein
VRGSNSLLFEIQGNATVSTQMSLDGKSGLQGVYSGVAGSGEREEAGEFLRIRITGGGCNGLSYKMKFVGDGKVGDITVLSEGVRLLVDSKTALYLRGTTLEFSDKLVGGGFKFSNPNAKASCSCGESFNL